MLFAEIDEQGNVLSIQDLPFNDPPNEFFIDVSTLDSPPNTGMKYVEGEFVAIKADKLIILTYRQFCRLMVEKRMLQIYTESMTNPMIQMWRDYIMASPEHLDVSVPEFAKGLDMLIHLESVDFNATDKETILAGNPLEK